MATARVAAIAHYLPEGTTTFDEIGQNHPDWNVAKLSKSLGITQLPKSAPDEFSSHLATEAARRLLTDNNIDPARVDYILLVTQTPDFPLPTTACLVQEALGLRQEIGALDVRLGCSGYVYALGLAKGLIESGQSSCLLLLTADVLTKIVNPDDKSTAPVFGDAGTATLLVAGESGGVGPLVYGTDGEGAGALVVPCGSIRPGASLNPESTPEARELASQGYDLYMDGSAVFNFTLTTVPKLVEDTLAAAEWAKDDVDLYVFHQANSFMLNHLRKKLKISEDKFWVRMGEEGNTGPSTIPLALSQAAAEGRLTPDSKVVLAGFGVGLSWAGAAVTW
ncbi:MAG: ketoacyl-ACP synthase III [Propionibacteriaceae bacterium]|nr:ketoacyl-ACP synthase III [Propionibacteriaceae bacterium]